VLFEFRLKLRRHLAIICVITRNVKPVG
jgi:hypothetical protein